MSDSLQPPWTVACQPPLFMEFPRQEYWRGLPCCPPGDLPDLGIEAGCPALQVNFFPSEPSGKPPLSLNSLKRPTLHFVHPCCAAAHAVSPPLQRFLCFLVPLLSWDVVLLLAPVLTLVCALPPASACELQGVLWH